MDIIIEIFVSFFRHWQFNMHSALDLIPCVLLFHEKIRDIKLKSFFPVILYVFISHTIFQIILLLLGAERGQLIFFRGFLTYIIMLFFTIPYLYLTMKKDFLKGLFCFHFGRLLFIIGSVISVIVLSFSFGLSVDLSNSSTHQVFITSFAIYFTVLCITYLANKFSFKYQIWLNHKILTIFAIILSAFIDLLLSLLTALSDTHIFGDLFNTFIMIILIVLTICILLYLGVNLTKKIKLNAAQKYTKEVEERQLEIRGFRHDYLNLLLTMDRHIQEENWDKLKSYFYEEISPTGQQLRQQNIELGNLGNLEVTEIKSLISAKVMQAQLLHIDVVVEIPEVVKEFNIKSGKLARILGILLDNAIEECEHCEVPKLSIAILTTLEHQVIVVKNTARETVPTVSKMFEKGFSTKGEKRGLGLSNVRSMVDKEGSTSLNTTVDTDSVTQELRIKIS